MATKKFCDRCGKEITGASHFAGMSTYQYEGCLPWELCESCAMHLVRWFKGKEKMVGEVEDDDQD